MTDMHKIALDRIYFVLELSLEFHGMGQKSVPWTSLSISNYRERV